MNDWLAAVAVNVNNEEPEAPTADSNSTLSPAVTPTKSIWQDHKVPALDFICPSAVKTDAEPVVGTVVTLSSAESKSTDNWEPSNVTLSISTFNASFPVLIHLLILPWPLNRMPY